MPDEPDPIAYTALQPGTPVHTSDGHPFATVQAVLVDEKVSVFDGIVVQMAEDARFVDADQIGSIYSTYVHTKLSAEQAATAGVSNASRTERLDSPDRIVTPPGTQNGWPSRRRVAA